MAMTFKMTRPFQELYKFPYPASPVVETNNPSLPIKLWIDPNPSHVVDGWDGQKYVSYTVPKMNGAAYVFDKDGYLVTEVITIPVSVAMNYNPLPPGNIGPNVNAKEVPPPLDFTKLRGKEVVVRSTGFTGMPVIGVFEEVKTDTERLVSIEKKLDDVIGMLKVAA